MAINIKRQKTVTLSDIISNQMDSFVLQRQKIRSEQEADFYRRVVDDGLDYDAQIAFWNERIKEEKGKSQTDKGYVKEMKGNLTDLRKLNRAKKFNDSYMESFEDLKTERKNMKQHIQFLERYLENAKDMDLKQTIQSKLTDAKAQYTENQNSLLENQATYAINDQSIPLIEQSIQKINQKKTEAVARGDEASILKWQNQIDSLNNAKTSINISKVFNDLEINGMQKDLGAEDYLNFYKKNLNAFENAGPVNINGTRYESVKDFWQGKMNDYVNQNFFTFFQEELLSKVSQAGKQLAPFLEMEIRDVNAEIDRISKMPEMAGFADKMNQLKTDVNYQAVTALGNKIYQDYKNGLMGETSTLNYQNALARLQQVNQKYDVDVGNFVNLITEEVAQNKDQTARNIAQIIAEYKAEGKSTEEATRLAQEEVPAVDLPSVDIINRTPVEVATEIQRNTEGEKTDYDIGSGKADFTPEKRTGTLELDTTKPTPEPEIMDKTEEDKPKQATLQLEDDESTKTVVDVGSQQASDLQSKGYKLI